MFTVVVPASSESSIEQHRYLKKTGSEIINFDWRLEQGDGLKLTTVLGEECDVTRMNSDLSTQSWTVNDPTTETVLSVLRNDNELMINGIFKGEKVERIVQIDASPWYQALSLSLRQFTDQSLKHIEFWSIRPDSLGVHHLQVSRTAEETQLIEGTSSEVIKLKIQLTGLKSVFWSCYYWLRKSDGLFVRYEGPSGPPGWPLTVVELIESSAQTKLGEKFLQVQ